MYYLVPKLLVFKAYMELMAYLVLTLPHELLVFLAIKVLMAYQVFSCITFPKAPWVHGLHGAHDLPVLTSYLVLWIPYVHGFDEAHDLPLAHGLPCPMNSLCSRPICNGLLTNLVALSHEFLVFMAYTHGAHGLPCGHGLPCPRVASYPWCCRNHLDPTWGKHRATVSKDIKFFFRQFHLCGVYFTVFMCN